jgi:hypothetical protein
VGWRPLLLCNGNSSSFCSSSPMNLSACFLKDCWFKLY